MTAYDPDILAPGLNVVFCGNNPALTAAADGHNFSSPTNRFWAVLHLAGFTDVRLAPSEERRLLTYGCGITAVVTRPTSRAADVSAAEYRAARPVFEAKIRRYRPLVLAFLGKRAFSMITDAGDVRWGPQPQSIAGSAAWVVPNPSGLNRAYSLESLVSAYAQLRNAPQAGSRPATVRKTE